MSRKCPVCGVMIEDYQERCYVCGAHFEVEQEVKAQIEADEVVDADEQINAYQQQMQIQQMLGTMTPGFQKLFSYYRMLNNKKIVLATTLMCYTSPVATLLTLMGIYQNIYLLTHKKELGELFQAISIGEDIEQVTKKVRFALLFNIGFLILSTFVIWYIYFYINS